MSIKTRNESGMNIYYDDDIDFLIEDYVKDKSIQNVKSVEMVRYRSKGVELIEAKTNSPNPHTIADEGYNDFINDILQKVIDTMLLLLGGMLKRYAIEDKFVDKSKYDGKIITFVLIVNKLDRQFLPELRDALRNKLLHVFKAMNWGSFPIIVLNKELALKKGYVK